MHLNKKNQGMLRCKNKPKCQIAWLNVWHESRLSPNEASTGNVLWRRCWTLLVCGAWPIHGKIKLLENENYDRKSVRMVSKNNYSKRNHNTHLSMHNNLVWLYQHLELVHYPQRNDFGKINLNKSKLILFGKNHAMRPRWV